MSSPARHYSRAGSHSRQRAHPKTAIFNVKLFLESNGLGRKIAQFRRKETIFSQGDPAKNVIYIQEGGVKLTVVNRAGKEAVVEILGPGDFFGVRSLGVQSVYTATATTIVLTTVLLIK
jgi:CRP/FNR family transcriptional regulator, cyclic AMP receptor protein